MTATALKQSFPSQEAISENPSPSVTSPYDGTLRTTEEVAADTVNKNVFTNDGKSYLVARNSDSGAHAFTVRGKSFSVPAGKAVHLGPFPVYGEFGRTIEVNGSDTHLLFSILTPDPRGGGKR